MDENLEPKDLRISDSDRQKVAEVLRDAAGDGRIDFEELDQRLEATYAAKTYGDLVPITLDLGAPTDHATLVGRPASTPAQRPERTPAGTAPTWTASLGLLGETTRKGVWDVGPTHAATALMGSVVIDLRAARFPVGEVIINANAVMGSVSVLVNAHTDVRVEGTGIMGSYVEGRAKVDPELDQYSPVVRVRGIALMGSVDVRRKDPR